MQQTKPKRERQRQMLLAIADCFDCALHDKIPEMSAFLTHHCFQSDCLTSFKNIFG
jgi:hypothetical protein